MRFIKLLSLIGAIALLGLIKACGGDTPEREPQATEIQISNMIDLSHARMQIQQGGNFQVIFGGTWNINASNRATVEQTVGAWVAAPNVTVSAAPGMQFVPVGLLPISYNGWTTALGRLPLGSGGASAGWITTRSDLGRIPNARLLTPADNLEITNADQLADIVVMTRDFAADNPGGRASVTFNEQINAGTNNRGLAVSQNNVAHLETIAQTATVTNPFIMAAASDVRVSHTILNEFTVVGRSANNGGHKFKTDWTADTSGFNLNDGQRLRTPGTLPLADKDPVWISDAVTVGDGMTNSQKLLPWHGWGNYGHQIEIQPKAQGGQIWITHLTDASANMFATPAAPQPNAPFTIPVNPKIGRYVPAGTSPAADDWHGSSEITHWVYPHVWNIKKASNALMPGYHSLLGTAPDNIGFTRLGFTNGRPYIHLQQLLNLGPQLSQYYGRNYRGFPISHTIDPRGTIVVVPDGMLEFCPYFGTSQESFRRITQMVRDSGWSISGLSIRRLSTHER